jgi:hypothetical protein
MATKESRREWYWKNREKVSEYQRQQYYKDREKELEYRRRWYYKNHEKALKYHQQYRCKNREARREYARRWYRQNREKRLMQRYSLGPGEYEQLFASQGGVCAICGNEPGKRRLCVDHSHTTGEVRGLLCSRCNAALGMFDEQIKVLKSAIRYLKNPPARCINQTRVVDSSSTVRFGGKEK